MIQIKNLLKIYEGNVIAINNLTLDIKNGVNGLVGENGAGKSTLFRCIADVYEKTSGQILIDGLDNKDVEAKKLIFFLSDDPFYFSNATTTYNMNFYSTLFDVDVEKYNKLMSKLNLPINRRLSTFSKGMRRQFFLCLALAINAKYYLLDEAFDGLDPLIQDIVREEILKEKDKTFILSSHNLLSLERLCDNFIVLSKGRCANEEKNVDVGKNYIKYQILFKNDVGKEDLLAKGVNVISFKKIGSIISLVVNGEQNEKIIKDNFEISLFENVNLDNDELIRIEMILAKGEEYE